MTKDQFGYVCHHCEQMFLFNWKFCPKCGCQLQEIKL